jgi:hypothetical protein
MKAVNTAKARIAACEAEIKALMTSLVANGDYEELPALAVLAGRLAELAAGEPAAVTAAGSETQASRVLAIPDVALVAEPKPAKKKLDYPRFERSEDRLIKVGWSKKDREEYEHKASKATARAVFEAIADASSSRDFVRVEDVLRVRGEQEEEIPSYQIYLVIAWLRSGGAIEKEGNEGYRINKKGLSFDRLWNATSPR